jgi:hypothetical protein
LRHDTPKSISVKEEFWDLCATCARVALVIAGAGVFLALSINVVMAGHSRSKNGVASLAYDPAIHYSSKNALRAMDCRVKPGNDGAAHGARRRP